MQKKEILKKYFGYDTFRLGQEQLIDQLLSGRDVLGIMPTGAGKSLCYQVPALIMEGITIVVSPLISLMKDQVRGLNEAGVHAAYINSSLTEGQIVAALRNAKEGRYKIVYVAPERLETPMFLEFAMHTKISMVTVDEAHCISQWGQDFRPSYRNIVTLIQRLPVRPVVSAFTATATETVREDILCVLGLHEPYVITTGFDRPNLYFEVRGSEAKNAALLQYVKEHADSSGIIYCATRKNVENVYELLKSRGFPCTRYHAGLGNEERRQNQEDFIFDVCPIVVATNAFGMGIDKSNVRYVIHYNMPQSLENYYQEAGRAGRDGEKAECILFYSPQDVMINKMLLERKDVQADMTEEDALLVQERDAARLRQMTNYCLTRECLRDYIRNYFGESAHHGCGNCSNCIQEFEERDVTELCRAILNCMQETNQRYGINVIVGVLRGEKKAKLLAYGLDALQSYGLCREKSEKSIKQVINEMLLRGYIRVTEDKYSVVKLCAAGRAVFLGEEKVLMKFSKQEEAVQDKPQSRTANAMRTSDILTSLGLELLDHLKALRLQIAREENMPPYIIFSDRTLIDMCAKNPDSRASMLLVNGVGEHKYEKYGDRFLEEVKTFVREHEGALAWEGKAGSMDFSVPVSFEKKAKKVPFFMTEEIEQGIVYEPELTVTEFAAALSGLRDESRVKRLSGAALTRVFEAEGYLKKLRENGVWKVKLSAVGEKFGLFTRITTSKAGNDYEVVCMVEAAQRSTVKRLKEDWKERIAEDEKK